eukprot:TRINITY_DN3909_c0_g4_i1.p1 TRINITY_DN3909_c0_g4~~TRINITY_DN3909_c0_g4_i1.p1  ORF type:complete len:549 (+),score=187.79 TRINITY_DN3909_c0_g4_i1:103-1749(+)
MSGGKGWGGGGPSWAGQGGGGKYDPGPAPPAYQSEIPKDLSVKLNALDKELDLRVLDALTCESLEAYMWSGIRGTHAVSSGKVAFAMTVMHGKLCRLGWSTASASLNLGQCDQSFGYGGTAKKSHNNKFDDYGETYSMGDTMTALMDFEANIISYCKNGRWLGEAFELPDWLHGVPLYPHILTKNCRVRAFFGEGDRSKFPELPDGFVWLSDASDLKATPWAGGAKVEGQAGVSRPEAPGRRVEPDTDIPFIETLYPGEKIGPGQRRLVMLVGLPGTGKTHWAKWYVKSNPHCRFNLISTNLILERKMPNTKWTYDDRWQKLIKEASQTMEEQLDIASREDGNIIWDQTNVYPNARRRKLQKFQHFHKTAVVFIPPEETHDKWVAQQKEAMGQNVPEDVVAQMKKNFELPTTSALFDNVIYAFNNTPDDVQQSMRRYKMEADETLHGARRRGDDYDHRAKFPRADYDKSYKERQFNAGNPYAPSLPYRGRGGGGPPPGGPKGKGGPSHSVRYTQDRGPDQGQYVQVTTGSNRERVATGGGGGGGRDFR